MKALHVVNVSFVLPYYIGEQFEYFQEKGIDFYVGCTPDDFLYQFSKSKKISVIPVRILREINLKEDIISIWRLSKVIRKEGIDIVIGHTPKGALIGLLAGVIAGVKSRVYFRHGIMYETSKGVKRFILRFIERFTGLIATQVICVSPSVLEFSNENKLSAITKNVLLNKGTCNGINVIKYNPLAIDHQYVNLLRSKYNFKPTDKVIGFVGRLVNDKGINELITAWKEIIKQYDNVKLFLVGPFEERDALSSSMKDYIKNEPTIQCTGLVNDTAPFYALMNIFILPSYREGFPTAVLEASAMELPVITTQVTGCRDSIVNNETGMFTTLNPMDITRKIVFYLENESIAKEHGLNGREFVLDNFDQKVIWQEIENKVFGFNAL